MKKTYIGAVIAATLVCSVTVLAQGFTFNTDLSAGSKGSDVSTLQTWLIANGYHIASIEDGTAAKGLFGAQTKAAVMKYQKAAGLPSTGFVGPLTRAKLNGGATASASSNTTSTASAPATAPGLPPGFTTPGVSGIMTVTSGPVSSSVFHAGDTQVPILNVRVQAQYSDIDVGGLVVDLGTNTNIYNKIIKTIYVVADGKTVFTTPLNPMSVVPVATQYVVGTAGYNVVVPKGTYKDIIVKADLYPSIDSQYLNQSPWIVSVDQNSVDGFDGVGQQLYGPATNGAIFNALVVNKSLADNAQANISLDPASPLTASIPVTDTTNNQYLGLPIMTFDVNAQNDTVHLHDVKVGIVSSGPGRVSAAYLFQGGTQIQSASVVNGVADFSNISDGTNGASIPVNTTVPYTVKVDVSSVTGATSITASTSPSMTIYNSTNGNVTISGIATSNTQTVSSSGPLFALIGSPTITKTVLSSDTNGNATTSYSATFNVQVTAVGQNVNLGLTSSSTEAAFSITTTSGVSTTSISIYKNGALDTFTNYTSNGGAVTASYSQPTNSTLGASGNYFTLSQNQTVTVPVTFTWLVKNPGANTFAAQLQGINWADKNLVPNQTVFMANQPTWRTPSI